MKKKQEGLTILDVIRSVQDIAGSDEEVVAVIAHLFGSRAIRLRGTPRRSREIADLAA